MTNDNPFRRLFRLVAILATLAAAAVVGVSQAKAAPGGSFPKPGRGEVVCWAVYRHGILVGFECFEIPVFPPPDKPVPPCRWCDTVVTDLGVDVLPVDRQIHVNQLLAEGLELLVDGDRAGAFEKFTLAGDALDGVRPRVAGVGQVDRDSGRFRRTDSPNLVSAGAALVAGLTVLGIDPDGDPAVAMGHFDEAAEALRAR